MAKAISMGEALIDFVALESGVTLQEATSFKKAPGGAPANVAAALAQLGVDCAFCGQVGDDAFGHFLEQTLAGKGVDTSLMRFSTTARTGLAFVALTRAGVPDFVFFRNQSADILFEASQLDLPALGAAKVFHFGSIALIDEPVRTATLSALEAAVACGTLVSYDPNYRPALWDSERRARGVMLSVLPQVDLLKVSEEELAFLTGKNNREQAAKVLLEQGPASVLVTRGAAGAEVFNSSEVIVEVPGWQVQVVDTTGCGDAFVAGVLYYLLEELEDARDIALQTLSEANWRECLRFANAMGALTATQRGAISALPQLADVQEWLATR